jgi:uncharacterized lipoprotein
MTEEDEPGVEIDGEGEEEDPIEELAAEVAAAAEAADLRDVEVQVVREHEEEQARELAELRTRRIDELHDWTLATLARISQEGPVIYVQSSNLEPGSRPFNVRWERVPRRHIVLDFNRYRGTIRVYQLTTVEGADVPGGRFSREIDAASEGAEVEIERAIRWTWQRGADRQP